MYSANTASAILVLNYLIQLFSIVVMVFYLIQLTRRKLTTSPDNITLFLAIPLLWGIASYFYLSYNLPALMKARISQSWKWENRGLHHTLLIDTDNNKYILFRRTATETQLGEINNRVQFMDTLSGASSDFTEATETETTLMQRFCLYLYEFPADGRFITTVTIQGPFKPVIQLGQNESIALH